MTFDDGVDVYWARQLALERLLEAQRELPPGVEPELAPISTGLGEIYQFTVDREQPPVKPGSTIPRENEPDPTFTGTQTPTMGELMDLRTILDWFIKPQLRTVPGVIEVNSFGGLEKQYEVLVDPAKLVSYRLTLRQVIEALERNNSNAGGAYLERGGEQQLLRGVGLIQSASDIENIAVASHGGTPVRVRDVARVGAGAQVRQGAATRDGKGEAVMGIAMLLKGENSRTVTERVRARLEQVQASLPPGVRINPFYDRTTLVDQTIRTATRNLIEGGLLVIGVLFLFLLQIRAGLIVSAAIPLSMLVSIIAMNYFGVSANLMSLGAIDFGLIVDGAVIIVENTVRRLGELRSRLGRPLTPVDRHGVTRSAAMEVLTPAVFGVLIIITAYLPILTLRGIEGKMFRPMALTVIFALVGALVLSLTLIPALTAFFLKEQREERRNLLLGVITRYYERILRTGIRHRAATVTAAPCSSSLCCPLRRAGAEFLPDLDEGPLPSTTFASRASR